MKPIRFGKVANLELSATPSAFVGFFLVWVLLSGAAIILLRAPFSTAVVSGLVATLLHWLSETLHQVGHILAARRTGYPMRGIRYFGVLSASLYPRDEPELPASIHIRRALGGPAASLFVALLAFLVVWLIAPRGEMVWWISLVFCAKNLLFFTLGALLPLGFTDGGTLLAWWKKL